MPGRERGRFTASTPGTIFNVAWATKVLLKAFFDEPVGGSSTVEQQTLTPSILVRIQVPQPCTSLIWRRIFSFRSRRKSPNTSAR